MNVAPAIMGLVLAGGASTRMKRDKAALAYHGEPQLLRAWRLLTEVTGNAFISVRADQTREPLRAGLPQIVDRIEDAGPIAGIVTALREHTGAAWLVVACDLPFLERRTLEYLVLQRDPTRLATAFRSSHDGLPEPLCAIYEPRALGELERYIATGRHCPRKFLIQSDASIVEQPDPRSLDNINTPEELREAEQALSPPVSRGATAR